jgi:hypothetical protein
LGMFRKVAGIARGYVTQSEQIPAPARFLTPG